MEKPGLPFLLVFTPSSPSFGFHDCLRAKILSYKKTCSAKSFTSAYNEKTSNYSFRRISDAHKLKDDLVSLLNSVSNSVSQLTTVTKKSLSVNKGFQVIRFCSPDGFAAESRFQPQVDISGFGLLMNRNSKDDSQCNEKNVCAELKLVSQKESDVALIYNDIMASPTNPHQIPCYLLSFKPLESFLYHMETIASSNMISSLIDQELSYRRENWRNQTNLVAREKNEKTKKYRLFRIFSDDEELLTPLNVLQSKVNIFPKMHMGNNASLIPSTYTSLRGSSDHHNVSRFALAMEKINDVNTYFQTMFFSELLTNRDIFKEHESGAIRNLYTNIFHYYLIRLRKSKFKNIFYVELYDTSTKAYTHGIFNDERNIFQFICHKISSSTSQQNIILSFVNLDKLNSLETFVSWGNIRRTEYGVLYRTRSAQINLLIGYLPRTLSSFFESHQQHHKVEQAFSVYTPLHVSWNKLINFYGKQNFKEQLLQNCISRNVLKVRQSAQRDLNNEKVENLRRWTTFPQETKPVDFMVECAMRRNYLYAPRDNCYGASDLFRNSCVKTKTSIVHSGGLRMGRDFSAVNMEKLPKHSVWDVLSFNRERLCTHMNWYYGIMSKKICVILKMKNEKRLRFHVMKFSNLTLVNADHQSCILKERFFWENSYCLESPQVIYETFISQYRNTEIEGIYEQNFEAIIDNFDFIVAHGLNHTLGDSDTSIMQLIPQRSLHKFIERGGLIWCTLFASQLLSGSIKPLQVYIEEVSARYSSYRSTIAMECNFLHLSELSMNIFRHQILSSVLLGTLTSIQTMMKSLFLSHVCTTNGICVSHSSKKKVVKFAVRLRHKFLREVSKIQKFASRHMQNVRGAIFKSHKDRSTRVPQDTFLVSNEVFARVLHTLDWNKPEHVLMVLNGSSADVDISHNKVEGSFSKKGKRTLQRGSLEDIRILNTSEQFLAFLMCLGTFFGCIDPCEWDAEALGQVYGAQNSEKLDALPGEFQTLCQQIAIDQKKCEVSEMAFHQRLNAARTALLVMHSHIQNHKESTKNTSFLSTTTTMFRIPCRIFILASDASIEHLPTATDFGIHSHSEFTSPQFALYDPLKSSFIDLLEPYFNTDMFEIPLDVSPRSRPVLWKLHHLFGKEMKSKQSLTFAIKPFLLILTENAGFTESIVKSAFPKFFDQSKSSCIFIDVLPLYGKRHALRMDSQSTCTQKIRLQSDSVPYDDNWNANLSKFPAPKERCDGLRLKCESIWKHLSRHSSNFERIGSVQQWAIKLTRGLLDTNHNAALSILLELAINICFESKVTVETIICKSSSGEILKPSVRSRSAFKVQHRALNVIRSNCVIKEMCRDKSIDATEQKADQYVLNALTSNTEHGFTLRLHPKSGYVQSLKRSSSILPQGTKGTVFDLVKHHERDLLKFSPTNMRKVLLKLQAKNVKIVTHILRYQKYFRAFQCTMQRVGAFSECNTENRVLLCRQRCQQANIHDPYAFASQHIVPAQSSRDILRGLFRSRYVPKAASALDKGYMVEIRLKGDSFKNFCHNIVWHCIVPTHQSIGDINAQFLKADKLQEIQIEFIHQLYKFNPFIQRLRATSPSVDGCYVGQICIPPTGTTVNLIGRMHEISQCHRPLNGKYDEAVKQFYYHHNDRQNAIEHLYPEIYTFFVDFIFCRILEKSELDIRETKEDDSETQSGNDAEKRADLGRGKISLCALHCPLKGAVKEDYLVIFDVENRTSVKDICDAVSLLRKHFSPLLSELYRALGAKEDHIQSKNDFFPDYTIRYGKSLRAMIELDEEKINF